MFKPDIQTDQFGIHQVMDFETGKRDEMDYKSQEMLAAEYSTEPYTIHWVAGLAQYYQGSYKGDQVYDEGPAKAAHDDDVELF